MENKFREFTVIECQDETYQALKYRKSHDQLVNSFHVIEIVSVEKLKVKLKTCEHDYWFMTNLLEKYSSDKDQAIKDCIERMKFRKPMFKDLV